MPSPHACRSLQKGQRGHGGVTNAAVVKLSHRGLAVCERLPPLSAVAPLGPHDRVGVVAVPKTATTSLTVLMQQAGLSGGCGGALWLRAAGGPGPCPKALQTPIKLSPLRSNPTKPLGHLLHTDYDELLEAWAALGHGPHVPLSVRRPTPGLPRLRTVVVLRDPVSRLYSAYVHGKQFHMRNKVLPISPETCHLERPCLCSHALFLQGKGRPDPPQHLTPALSVWSGLRRLNRGFAQPPPTPSLSGKKCR